MVKVVKLFTDVLWKRCSESFIGNHLCGSLFFNKALGLQAKERLMHRCFPVSFTKYFRTLFLQNTPGWLPLLNILFLLVTSTSATKRCFLQPLLFKYFRDKHCELLANSPFWVSYTDSQSWLCRFIANRLSDVPNAAEKRKQSPSCLL